jgi:RHS repeat-associated protein
MKRSSATSPFAGSTTRYLPFGSYRNSTGHTVTDRGYTGHRHNDDLGLIYMNARYYLPGIGRFASPDTIVSDPADPQSFNRYSYSYNNPLKYSDPSGHCIDGVTTWACIAAAAAIGGGVGLIVDYSVQVIDNVSNQDLPFWQAVYKDNISWSSVFGSTVGGGVGGGIAAPIAALAGPSSSVIGNLGWSGLGGLLGGAFGGQAGSLSQATISEVGDAWAGRGFNGTQMLENAAKNGFLDPGSILLDSATGVVFAWAGEGLNSAIHGINPFKLWQGTQPSVPMVKYTPHLKGGVSPTIVYSGRSITLSMSQYELLMNAIAQGSIDLATELLIEFFNASTTESLQP